MLRHRLPALALVLALPACGDDGFSYLFGDQPDVGFDAAADGGSDAGQDGGAPDGNGGGDAGNADPCEDACGPDQLCTAGACTCPDGLVVSGSLCLEADAENPALRTAEQVCARWNADYPEQASASNTEGPGACDPGAIDPTGHEDAMRRLNLYRWLVGVEPAGVDWDNQALAQYAAVMFDAANQISHFPPDSWPCYTEQAATAAGSSNIALGYGSAAQTVDGYVGDTGVPSLGHRRWCLSPSLDDTGFGHYGRGGAMWAFGSTPRTSVLDFVAYPPPGPVPAAIAPGEWSFSRDGGLAGATITVRDLTSGEDVPVSSVFKDQGYAQDTIGWTMPRIAAGQRYAVTVSGTNGEWNYELEFVSCR